MPTLLDMALARIGARDDDGQGNKLQTETARETRQSVESNARIDSLALDNATSWHERFQRQRNHYQGLGYDVGTSNALAAGHLLTEMHSTIAREDPPDPTTCAGCGETLEGECLDLGDGARVHDQAGQQCLIAYGRRWRQRASEQLKKLGIEVPVSVVIVQ